MGVIQVRNTDPNPHSRYRLPIQTWFAYALSDSSWLGLFYYQEPVLTRVPSSKADDRRMRAFSVLTSGHVTKMADTIRSAIAQNPIVHKNFMALYCIEPEVLMSEYLRE